jgi:hypothetical protein
MATYSEIQEYVRGRHDFTPKTCWIAQAKEIYGLPLRKAWNRKSKKRKQTCSSERIKAIREAFEHFNMI